MSFSRIAAVVAPMLIAASAPAAATIYQISYSGTFWFGSYHLAPNDPMQSLAGKPFEIVWRIDDSKGYFVSKTSTFVYLRGGTDFETSSPISAVVTIPGIVTFDVPGLDFAYTWRHDSPPGVPDDYVSVAASDYSYERTGDDLGDPVTREKFIAAAFFLEDDPGGKQEEIPQYGTLLDTVELGAPLARPIASTDYLIASITSYERIFHHLEDRYEDLHFIDGYAHVGTLRFERISAVPEPASWVMMIGGFALVGSAMRRRKPDSRLVRR